MCRHYYLSWDDSWLGRGMLSHCLLGGNTEKCKGTVLHCPIDEKRRICNTKKREQNNEGDFN